MILNAFLDGVAMMIAICLVVVVCAFVFWAVAATVRLIRRSGLIADVAVWRLIWTQTLKEWGLFSSPDVPIATWCQGCDELVSPARMAFTDGWRYRCDNCRRPHRQFVMDVSSVEDVKAGREVLAVHNGGQVSVIRTALPERCDVCESPAPPWKTGSYRCVECRNERRYRLPATAAEYMQQQRKRAFDTALHAAAAPVLAREARKLHQQWVDMGSDDRR